MKFNFHVSPNYRGKLTTQGIMRDLSIGLLVVYLSSFIYYWCAYGMRYALQLVLMLAASLATTFVCEFVFAKAQKKDPVSFIKTSFGWVTSMILVLMCTIDTPIYAIIIATFFSIAVARLMFGGFAQNVFNPAAVGRAVIFAAFSGKATDLITSATPTGVLASSYHWLPGTQVALEGYLEEFGGFWNLLLGNYPGATGETFSLIILIVGCFLVWRRVMEWRIPVVYLSTIAVMSAIIALLTGLESYNGVPAFLWYPALQLLTGGVIFGGVFMLTDPVTSPTDPAARVFWAMCTGILTVLIRLNANLPEGCLYSILIMNCFTPMVEGALDGKQLEQIKKAWIMLACAALVGIGVCFYSASNVERVDTASAASSSSSATSSATESGSETEDDSVDSHATGLAIELPEWKVEATL